MSRTSRSPYRRSGASVMTYECSDEGPFCAWAIVVVGSVNRKSDQRSIGREANLFALVRPRPTSVAFWHMSFDIIRDPLWNNIRVDPLTLSLIDTPVFQRLRYVRQLGLAFYVYPGATHSRFEHALGAYHLVRRTLGLFEERDTFEDVREERRIVRAAALLHDIGHYPLSHALEEIGALHYEEVSRPLICEGSVAEILRAELGSDAP